MKQALRYWAGFVLLAVTISSGLGAAATAQQSSQAVAASAASRQPAAPAPFPDHPGNIFLEGETVRIHIPTNVPLLSIDWRLSNDRSVVATGILPARAPHAKNVLDLGSLGIGWYRLEFGATNTTNNTWTSLAVLGRLRAPVPAGSPIAVDSAAAWFAHGDPAQQRRLANLAALAGVGWVRDRLRWREIQPAPGELIAPPTTYDTSADAHRDAGLALLQVFHDTPSWAREGSGSGGQFAPDLRRVYQFAQLLAKRFQGRVAAWEPWNEANVAAFGAHTVDQMCSWQKAAWLGFKAGDPDVLVGWNPTAALPTVQHTEGVLANETWPYFDTYNIHTYDWSQSYADLWKPAREAAAGRPIWITEADRGTPHLKNAPWFDQDPQLERLKAEWLAQAYASSLFAGAKRHFHFILGNYQEPNGVQFGLLRLDLTPRPAYVALAAVGRCLAGAKVLGRWRPGEDGHVYAFRAQPDGQDRDVLVAWAEKDVDWEARGRASATWKLPEDLRVQSVVDYLGRPLGAVLPKTLTSAPIFVFLPPGQAARLLLEPPPPLAARRGGDPSPVVMQLSLPRSVVSKVEDLPWSEGHVYSAPAGGTLELTLHVYNFGVETVAGRPRIIRQPNDWELTLATNSFQVAPMGRQTVTGTLRMPSGTETRDGWAVLHGEFGPHGQPALAFRVRVRE